MLLSLVLSFVFNYKQLKTNNYYGKENQQL